MRRQITRIFHSIIGKKARERKEASAVSQEWQDFRGVQERSDRPEPQRVQELQSIHAPSEQKFQSMPTSETQRFSAGRSAGGTSEAPADWKNFIKIIDRILTEERTGGWLLIAGLDRFKEINDIYGRDTGDSVLQNVADTFRNVFGENICLCRLRGDIFALWMSGVYPNQAEYVRRQVGIVNDRLLHAQGGLPPVSLSAGVAFREEGDDCRRLGKKAIVTLYKVKESGRCGCEIYAGA